MWSQSSDFRCEVFPPICVVWLRMFSINYISQRTCIDSHLNSFCKAPRLPSSLSSDAKFSICKYLPSPANAGISKHCRMPVSLPYCVRGLTAQAADPTVQLWHLEVWIKLASPARLCSRHTSSASPFARFMHLYYPVTG